METLYTLEPSVVEKIKEASDKNNSEKYHLIEVNNEVLVSIHQSLWIWSINDYCLYLQTIFPNSEYKNLLFHWSPNIFDEFDLSVQWEHQSSYANIIKKWIYLSPFYSVAKSYSFSKWEDIDEETWQIIWQKEWKVYLCLVNITKDNVVDADDVQTFDFWKSPYAIASNIAEIAVWDLTLVHILWSSKDKGMFQDYINYINKNIRNKLNPPTIRDKFDVENTRLADLKNFLNKCENHLLSEDLPTYEWEWSEWWYKYWLSGEDILWDFDKRESNSPNIWRKLHLNIEPKDAEFVSEYLKNKKIVHKYLSWWEVWKSFTLYIWSYWLTKWIAEMISDDLKEFLRKPFQKNCEFEFACWVVGRFCNEDHKNWWQKEWPRWFSIMKHHLTQRWFASQGWLSKDQKNKILEQDFQQLKNIFWDYFLPRYL